MAYIKVDISKMRHLESQLNRVPSVISSTASTVRSVRRGLDWDVACEASIDSTLRIIASRLDASDTRMQKTVRFLDSAAMQYSNVEFDGKNPNESGTVRFSNGGGGGGGSGYMGGDGSRISAGPATVEMSPEEKNAIIQKMAKKALSKFGPIGGAMSVLTEPIANWLNYGKFEFGKEDDNGLMKLAKFGKAVVSGYGTISAFQKISKNADLISRFKNPGSHPIFGGQHNEYKIKNFLGLNKFDFRKALGDDALLGKSGLGWDSFKHNVAVGYKHNLKSTFIKPGGKINKAGILGVVMDFAIKGVENWNDFKSGKISSGDRAVVETVTETAFDLALTAGATTVISAGLVAIGAVSTPALVVGVAAGIAVTGINELTKAVTGSTLTQHVGNLAGNIYDAGKETVANIAEGIGTVAKKGVDVIKSAKEKMNKLGNQLAEKTKSLFTTSILKPAWL